MPIILQNATSLKSCLIMVLSKSYKWQESDCSNRTVTVRINMTKNMQLLNSQILEWIIWKHHGKHFVEKSFNSYCLKGAEANLYTFRNKPISEGIQICFRTLYWHINLFCTMSNIFNFAWYLHFHLKYELSFKFCLWFFC